MVPIVPTVTVQQRYSTNTPSATFTPTTTLTETPVSPTATFIPTATLVTLTPFEEFVEQCKGKGEHGIACIYAIDSNGNEILRLSNLLWGNGTIMPVTLGSEAAQIWVSPWNATKTIWILEHDNHGGDLFYKLHGNVKVFLIHTDGSWQTYGIAEQEEWFNIGTRGSQALYSRSPDREDSALTTSKVIAYYSKEGNIIFQTCMGKENRLIAKAVPIINN